VQPIHGLAAVALLLGAYRGAPRGRRTPIFSVIGSKTLMDFALHLLTVHLYHRWTGDTAAASLWMVIVAAVVDPFTSVAAPCGRRWAEWIFLADRARGACRPERVWPQWMKPN
jgi:hypothetical protein